MSIISISHLTKRFDKITAFEDITFDIQRGEVFGLLGPNGAGKTTLIRTLIGILEQSAGEAKVFGLDNKREKMKIRERTSLLPQESQPYENLSARENISFYGRMHGTLKRKEIDQRTEELIDLVGLRGRENDRVREFSGGMKRKVLVARAMVMNPDLIFLDEPTTGVDVIGARIVRNLIKKMATDMGKTIILTTHDLNEVDELCDRVAIMVDGRIVAIGKPDDLENQFKKNDLEDVFIGLVTGEGIDGY